MPGQIFATRHGHLSGFSSETLANSGSGWVEKSLPGMEVKLNLSKVGPSYANVRGPVMVLYQGGSASNIASQEWKPSSYARH